MIECMVTRCLILVLTATVVLGQVQAPVFNEVMSLNTTTVQDEDGDYPDWIELYNPHDIALDIGDYGLSDDPGDPFKWVFSDVDIPPRRFLLVFASSKNRADGFGPFLHTNFKISSRGECLYLSHPSGQLVDSVAVLPLAVDISFGRTPDAGEKWAYFFTPTPGESNQSMPLTGFAVEPKLSLSGDFYGDPIDVVISADEGAQIYYTTDGSVPGKSSRLFREAVKITETTVLRSRAFQTGLLPSPVNTQTYFIRGKSELAIISLSTHPDNLFDDDIGIYVEGNGTALGGYPSNPIGPPANYWEDWERPVHVELFEPDGRTGFSVDAGIKMAGKTTRTLPQKSFAIFLRNRYGTGELVYPMFPGYPVDRFKSFILRNAGSDNTINEGAVHFRDGLASWLVSDLDLDFQAYRPCIVYINGEYWGIYGIREKLNEDYLASHHGVDPENVDMLDDYHTLYPIVIEGDADHYNALIDYLKSHDLKNRSYASYVQTQMDVDNFLTYMAVQIYFANQDGPGHNCKFWRSREQYGRYRWLLYDTDHSFGMRIFIPNFHFEPEAYLDNTIAYYREANGPSWPNPPESTFMFRKILENEEFRYIFVNKIADFLNSVFRDKVVRQKYETIKGLIEYEIERHFNRWGGDHSLWRKNTEVIENFLSYRADYLRDHVIEEFDLGGIAEVVSKVEPAGAGQIKINSLYLTEFPRSGIYFQDVPVEVTAIPAIGYRFARWDGLSAGQSTTTANLQRDISFTAVFEKTVIDPTLVINEINYNAPPEFDTDDWIELYNPLETVIDISGWRLQDENDDHVFVIPEKTCVDKYGYIVVCRDSTRFLSLWPEAVNVTGNFDFGLNNDREKIRLYDSTGVLMDSLIYTNSAPWPWQADGTGATLALRNPNLDNTKPENWMASFFHGTPGTPNVSISAIDTNRVPDRFLLKSIYPNPFNAKTTILFDKPDNSYLAIKIYDLLGREIRTVLAAALPAGEHKIQWDGQDNTGTLVASGVYIVFVKGMNDMATRKVTFVK